MRRPTFLGRLFFSFETMLQILPSTLALVLAHGLSTATAFQPISFVHPPVASLPSTLSDSAFFLPSSLVVPNTSSMLAPSSLLISEFSMGATVSSGVQFLVFGITAVLLLAAIGVTLFAQVLVPNQMNNLEAMLESDNPQGLVELKSQLEPGQSWKDRPELMAQLVELGMNSVKDEREVELQNLLELVQNRSSVGLSDTLRERLEAGLEMTIEEYIAKVERNTNSGYLTDAGRELAQALQDALPKDAEIVDKTTKDDDGDDEKDA